MAACSLTHKDAPTEFALKFRYFAILNFSLLLNFFFLATLLGLCNVISYVSIKHYESKRQQVVILDTIIYILYHLLFYLQLTHYLYIMYIVDLVVIYDRERYLLSTDKYL